MSYDQFVRLNELVSTPSSSLLSPYYEEKKTQFYAKRALNNHHGPAQTVIWKTSSVQCSRLSLPRTVVVQH
ncbi:hypothetical protein ACOSP7_027894 [Xanthoceras sorbifolium]